MAHDQGHVSEMSMWLQAIIRASMVQQGNASTPSPAIAAPATPAISLKSAFPLPPSGFLPPPPASAQVVMRTTSTSLTPQASLDFDPDEDDDDEDWDDFQAHEAQDESLVDSSTVQGAQSERDVQGQDSVLPRPSMAVSASTTEEGKSGDVLANPIKVSSPGTPAESGEGGLVEANPADSKHESSGQKVDNEEMSVDESTKSDLSNSTVLALSPTSRVPDTSQIDDEEAWDTFESAPATLTDIEEASSYPLHANDDDDDNVQGSASSDNDGHLLGSFKEDVSPGSLIESEIESGYQEPANLHEQVKDITICDEPSAAEVEACAVDDELKPEPANLHKAVKDAIVSDESSAAEVEECAVDDHLKPESANLHEEVKDPSAAEVEVCAEADDSKE